MGKNVREIFAAFDDKQPERFLGAGDVKYHLGYSTRRGDARRAAQVHLSLAFNPSHLEFVNPVVEGRVRAKIDRRKRKSTMPLLVHGDAAFMGQGVVAETLNLARLEGYTTGGTIHLVVNNQIGFTTVPSDSRSTRYCTDIARELRVPVFHVNGEDPEAVIQVTRLAIEFRQRFKQDVVIDMYCYRKYGHNEGDEPRFTQPLMYALIDKKPTVREVYVERLVDAGHITREEADAIAQERRATLETALEEARKGDYQHDARGDGRRVGALPGGPDAGVPEVADGVPEGAAARRARQADDDARGLPREPQGAEDPRAAARARRSRATALDWGTAEHLAFASILLEGHGIRISGQDARRGTFSHRHAVLFDTETGEPYTPLAHLGDARRRRRPLRDLRLARSARPASSASSTATRSTAPTSSSCGRRSSATSRTPRRSSSTSSSSSAEDKWSRLSGLVLLLPHGFEGQGPEHSSARIERFLQLAAEDNIQVCNLTTPAQLFHVLRRQVNRPWRKPLVVFTPKSLLRHPEAVSTLDELADGLVPARHPRRRGRPGDRVKRILLCSGKVYYDLAAERRKRASATTSPSSGSSSTTR